MVKSFENGISLPAFLVKCYAMLSDESTNDLISWSESNDSFIIWDESQFSSQLLPKYFKHCNFSSFVRQLNIYGFRKIDTDRWQFANELFIKGQKHLLKNIVRRKHPQNSTRRKSLKEEVAKLPQTSSHEDDKRAALWKEVENLKTDKNALTQELKNLRQHQQNSRSKLLLLRDQLNGMEKNQQQMLSFIVMVMQSPEFIVQFVQPKENSWRVVDNGNSKLSEVTDDHVPSPSDGTIVAYQPPIDGSSVIANSLESANYSQELMDLDLDFSSDELRDLLVDFDFFMSPKGNPDIPWENPEMFRLTDKPENDEILDHLLSSDPSSRVDEQVTELRGEHCDHSEMQIGSANHPKESETHSGSEDDATEDQNGTRSVGTSEKLKHLTKQMEDM